MDRGAWQAIAHSVAKSQIQLSSQACTQEKKQATYKPKDLNILKDYPFPGRSWLQVLLLPTITQSLPHIRFHPHQHTMIASWEWIGDALYLSIASKQPGQKLTVTCFPGWGTAFPGASSAWTAPPPRATQALGSVPRRHGFLCPAASLHKQTASLICAVLPGATTRLTSFKYCYSISRVSLVAQMVKNPPAMLRTWVQSLGQEDWLEKETATHSSILFWRIPWTEGPGGLQPMGLQRIRHDWALFHSPLSNLKSLAAWLWEEGWICLMHFYFCLHHGSMWDLSSLTRYRTCAPELEEWDRNHRTTREVPTWCIFKKCIITPAVSDRVSLLLHKAQCNYAPLPLASLGWNPACKPGETLSVSHGSAEAAVPLWPFWTPTVLANCLSLCPPASQVTPQSIQHLETKLPVLLVLSLKCWPHFLWGMRTSLCKELVTSPLSISSPHPTPSRHRRCLQRKSGAHS